MFTATKEQVEDWKKQYGTIHRFKVEDKSCYLRTPDRKTLSYAATAGKADPMKANEAILKNCWLAGDEEIMKDDAYFLAVSGKLDQIVEIKEAELEKL